MIPTIVASLTTGSILMISTLTSAIALSTASVIQVAGIQNSQMPQALFTITLLVGAIMFVMGLLRHSGNLSVKPSRRALELGRHAKSWTICSLCLWRGDGHCGCLRPGITRGLHDFCRVIAFY
jgi:hypothetical protein